MACSLPPVGLNESRETTGVRACCREVFWLDAPAEVAARACAMPAGGSMDTCAEAVEQRHFSSTLDGLRKIARHDGPRALWRGLSPSLIMAIPANVIYFTAYDWLRLDEHSPIYRFVPDTYAALVGGSVARTAAAAVISPIEMFRTRLQATPGSSGVGSGGRHGHFGSTLAELAALTRTHGYSALWRGLGLTMWRDVPFSGMYWFGYETMRNRITDARAGSYQTQLLAPDDSADHHNLHVRRAEQRHEAGLQTFLDAFAAGATSGAIAALVTTPFDVGKTRQQLYRHGAEAAAAAAAVGGKADAGAARPPEQLSVPRFLLHIAQTEGVGGLFKGWTARCLKVAPSCAIMISTYELGKKCLGNQS